MIATTLGELIEAAQGLHVLASKRGWSEKTKYHIVKLAKKVASETKVWDARRQELIEELGIEVGKEIPPAARKPFMARMKELNDVPVEIAWGPVTRAMLADAKQDAADVTAAELLALGPLFVDEDEPAKD